MGAGAPAGEGGVPVMGQSASRPSPPVAPTEQRSQPRHLLHGTYREHVLVLFSDLLTYCLLSPVGCKFHGFRDHVCLFTGLSNIF